MVAAWMRAETGVGPAMASGSHTYSGSWADLPAAPTNSSAAIAVAVVTGRLWAWASSPVGPEYDSVPRAWNVKNIATMKPQSPMRFVTNAFLPATALASSVNQNEMSQYEQAPTPSHPRNVSSMLSPSTSTSIEKANRLRYVKKRGKPASPR